MNFIIIHGVNADPNANWFPWLKNELERAGYEVTLPIFPTPGQSLESWLGVIEKYETKINEETVLIGHSLGASFIMDYLEKTNKKIKAVFLVAGFFKQLGSPFDEINKSFVDKEFNWEKIRNSCGKFFVFGSDNDQFVPLEMTKELAQNLNAELNIISGGGHLNKEAGYDEFHVLFYTILIELE